MAVPFFSVDDPEERRSLGCLEWGEIKSAVLDVLYLKWPLFSHR